jgi:hypothetical protein
MTDWLGDFDWQRKFSQEIRNIVGPRFVVEAPWELDIKQATDLMIFCARDARIVQIGARMRRVKYLKLYPYDVTIRSARQSGVITELEKIIDGWLGWLFYGFAGDDTQTLITRWFIIDLNSWRSHVQRHKPEVWACAKKRLTKDGERFVAFNVKKLVMLGLPNILFATSHPQEFGTQMELGLVPSRPLLVAPRSAESTVKFPSGKVALNPNQQLDDRLDEVLRRRRGKP